MKPALLQSLDRLGRGQVLTRCELGDELWAELRSLGIPEVQGSKPALGFEVAPELLDASEIRACGLLPSIGLDCRWGVDSTNTALVAAFQHRHALLAECQSGGRGRHGRRWLSPFAGGLWFSYGYRFALPVERLGPLTLAVGVALAEVLDLPQLRLKWPNDLRVDGAKLGGILVEARSTGTATEAVIGVGINLSHEFPTDAVPDQPWTALARHRDGPPPRNRLVANMIGAIDAACARFEIEGFAPFRSAWSRLDALAGRPIRIEHGSAAALLGRADGITGDGLLRLIDAQGVEHQLNSGEVRVRDL